MRLFTALDLPADVVHNLEELLARLRSRGTDDRPGGTDDRLSSSVSPGGTDDRFSSSVGPPKHIQWSPPSNLHITTKFIGQWPEERLAELKTALAALPGRPAIPVHIRQLGFFPNPHSPRVFNCGVDAPGLEALARDTDRAMTALGLESEKRAYTPHLTMARIKPKLNLQPLREAIASLPSQDFGRFEAARFFLYQSQMRPTGSVYTKLAEFSLSK